MTIARRSSKASSQVYAVDADTLPQTIEVSRTRAEPLGIVVQVFTDEPPRSVLWRAPAVPGASGRGARPQHA
jgi:glycine dehydrogenase